MPPDFEVGPPGPIGAAGPNIRGGGLLGNVEFLELLSLSNGPLAPRGVKAGAGERGERMRGIIVMGLLVIAVVSVSPNASAVCLPESWNSGGLTGAAFCSVAKAVEVAEGQSGAVTGPLDELVIDPVNALAAEKIGYANGVAACILQSQTGDVLGKVACAGA